MTRRFVSIKPVMLNGWVVQGSIFDNDSICIVLYNVDYLQSIVRYFTDEVQAHLFVNDVIFGDCDVSEEGES